MSTRAIMALLAGTIVLGACATGYGDYRYEGRDFGARDYDGGELSGPGVGDLDPWLAETREGRQLVRMGWRDAADGSVSEDVADRANIWFRRYADENRDMRLTDAEIRTALVAGSRGRR